MLPRFQPNNHGASRSSPFRIYEETFTSSIMGVIFLPALSGVVIILLVCRKHPCRWFIVILFSEKPVYALIQTFLGDMSLKYPLCSSQRQTWLFYPCCSFALSEATMRSKFGKTHLNTLEINRTDYNSVVYVGSLIPRSVSVVCYEVSIAAGRTKFPQQYILSAKNRHLFMFGVTPEAENNQHNLSKILLMMFH